MYEFKTKEWSWEEWTIKDLDLRFDFEINVKQGCHWTKRRFY